MSEAKANETITSPQHEVGPQNGIIKLQATTLDPRSTDPNIRYKAKLRLNFTNGSKNAIEVLEPTWTASQWDVPFQHPFGYCYRIESNPGGWKRDEWNSQELKKAHVDPGQGFQIYVGLSESIPATDLEKEIRPTPWDPDDSHKSREPGFSMARAGLKVLIQKYTDAIRKLSVNGVLGD